MVDCIRTQLEIPFLRRPQQRLDSPIDRNPVVARISRNSMAISHSRQALDDRIMPSAVLCMHTFSKVFQRDGLRTGLLWGFGYIVHARLVDRARL